MTERPFRSLICAPHTNLESAKRSARGFLDHAAETMIKHGATEIRLTVGEDPIGVFFNEVEVR